MNKTETIYLGQEMKLERITFGQLIDPALLCRDPEYKTVMGSLAVCNSRPLKTISKSDIEALQCSIKKYGLLNPFVVARHPALEKDKKKYAIIDGQRRYLAIKNLLFPPKPITEFHEFRFQDEEEYVQEEEATQITDCYVVPALIYPYKTFEEMRRHSIEDNKFGVKPSSKDLDCAERLDQGKGIMGDIAEMHQKIHVKVIKEGQEKGFLHSKTIEG